MIGIGATHETVDDECAQLIQKAFPEMVVEGANRQEINQPLVVEAVSVMGTFQVRTRRDSAQFRMYNSRSRLSCELIVAARGHRC